MRFMHIADIHLGAVPDKGQPWSGIREEEIWKSFRRALQEARREQVDLLLIAGDLFHRQPLLRDLKEVNYLLGSLKGIQVVFIAGNHDYLKRGSAYQTFQWEENITFLGGRQCECVHFPRLHTTVYGLSYYEKEIREPLYDEMKPDPVEGCHILLAHGGDDQHIPIDKRKLLKSGFDYIALGHIHKPWCLAENRMAYAGALEPLDVNDTGAHGYILGEYRSGKVRTRFVPFASREYIHVEVESQNGSTDFSMREQLGKMIESYGKNHIYKVYLRGFRDPDIRYHTENWKELGNILEIVDETEPSYDFKELLRLHGDDVVGRYIKKLWEGEGAEKHTVRQQALYYGIQAMLSE